LQYGFEIDGSVGPNGLDVVPSVILRVVPSKGLVVLSVVLCVVPSEGLDVGPLTGFSVVAFVGLEMVKRQLQLQVDESALSNPSDLQLQLVLGDAPSDGFGAVAPFVAVQLQLQVDRS